MRVQVKMSNWANFQAIQNGGVVLADTVDQSRGFHTVKVIEYCFIYNHINMHINNTKQQ